MRNNEPDRISLIWLLLAALFAVAVVFDVAYGSGTDIDQETSVVVAGDSSRAFGLSGGDMDINDCLATHSVLFGFWQGTHVNKLCEAERLNREGRYQSAAEMKCSVRGIRRVYGDDCIDSVILTAPSEVVEVHLEDEEDWREEQAQMQIDYDARIEQLEQTINKPAPKPRVIERTVVEKKPFLSDEKRAKLQAILEEE
jgi:hypothetical protein